MSSQSIKDKLAAFVESNKPVDELNLLRAAIPFIIEAHKYGQATGTDTIQTIHYTLDNWWRNQPTIRNNSLRSRPRDNLYTCCYKCGCVFQCCIIPIVADCAFCRHDNSLPSLGLHFLLDFLAYRTDINVHWWEKLIADYIYDRWCYEQRNN